jgi:choline monooxygenase
MSDLSITRDALHRGASQLPVASYFDAALFERERDALFRRGPRYVGHALAVPESGDYHTLAQEGDGRALTRTKDGVELVSNVCRHRQALMLRGRGTTKSGQGHAGTIVCPLHRWTYDLHGRLIGAPHFAEDPCLNLANYPLQHWNGLLFEADGCNVATDLAALGARADLDFSGYVYDRTYLHECDYNWKTFIEVYLEDYHVGPFHPGLGNFVSCDDLQWEMGRDYSVQTVGVAHSGGEALGRAGSPVYRQWQDAVLRYQNGTPPRHGAVWLTYYPGVMVEWYPNVLVVSTLIPRSARRTLNVVEFFYPEEIAAFERE